MRKYAVLFVVVIAVSLCSLAADAPKAEIYGGYSFFRADLNESLTGISPQNTSGWNAALTVPLNRYFGITADLSGQYKSESVSEAGVGSASVSVHEHNFLFGPTLTYRNASKLTPFVHALFGVSHLTASGDVSLTDSGSSSGSGSDNSFAMAVGGGLDVKITRVVALRLGQFDWLRTQHVDQTQNNLRYSAGVVFNFK